MTRIHIHRYRLIVLHTCTYEETQDNKSSVHERGPLCCITSTLGTHPYSSLSLPPLGLPGFCSKKKKKKEETKKKTPFCFVLRSIHLEKKKSPAGPGSQTRPDQTPSTVRNTTQPAAHISECRNDYSEEIATRAVAGNCAKAKLFASGQMRLVIGDAVHMGASYKR